MGVHLLQYNRSKLYFEIGLPIIIITMGAFIAGVILNTLNKPSLFLNGRSKTKYADSRLSPDESKTISKSIIRILEKDKLYLNPELNLEDLAKAINFNSRQVSWVINHSYEKSFFDLINSYRIKAATERFKKTRIPNLPYSKLCMRLGLILNLHSIHNSRTEPAWLLRNT